MTALTKNTFTFPNLGSVLQAWSKGSAKKVQTAKSIASAGVLVPCQWNSLSDVRRHRPSKYVHQIRLSASTGAIELRLMHFKAPKNGAKNQRIDAATAIAHTIRVEHGAGGVQKVRFGTTQGLASEAPSFTQTLEGNTAKQFVSTLARGWIGAFLPKHEMAQLESLVQSTTKKPDMAALVEATGILVERAAVMHQRMLQSYDNPAAARALDQAVLYLYEKGVGTEEAAQRFQVDALDVLSRKRFFDKISDALGKPASQMVVEHLVVSERADQSELSLV